MEEVVVNTTMESTGKVLEAKVKEVVERHINNLAQEQLQGRKRSLTLHPLGRRGEGL